MNNEIVSRLETQVVENERAGREARGLPPWHVLNFAEFPFAFAQEDLQSFADATERWLAAEPTNTTALLSAAFARIAQRNYSGADALMAQIQPQRGKGRMRFAAASEPPHLVLPDVKGAYPTGPALFLACDATYFAVFGIPLLKSIAAHNMAVPLHIHLMAKEWSLIDQVMAAKGPMTVTATMEDPFPFIEQHGLTPGFYFCAARFVRFAEAVRASSGAVCMVDVDSLANGDPMKILNTPGAVGLRVRPGRLEPWNQFSACLVLGRPEGRPYFDEVARTVTANLTDPWWGLDQYALFSAWVRTRPELSLFGPREADVAGIDGIFTFTAGEAKKRLLKDDTPYARLFRKYR